MSVYSSADSRLCGSLERPGKLWGSVYWDSVAEEAGGWEGIRDIPEKREAFYAAHFPDDIPDEWSLAERAKSHGIGSLQKDEVPSIKKFVRSWFGALGSAVVWNHGQDLALPVNLEEACIGHNNVDLIKSEVLLPCVRVLLVV
jgi:hypothetical protein